MLRRALSDIGDDFIIGKYIDDDGKEIELVIDSIGHHKVHCDTENMTCLCLNLRNGGQGCIKR